MTKRKANKGKLTEAVIRKAADGEHPDGRGLTLRVANGGSRKSWVLRTMVNGKTTVRGLGGYPGVSLAAARKAADAIRSELKAGGDAKRPAAIVAEQQAVATPKPVTAGQCPTFEQCAEQVFKLRQRTWRSTSTQPRIWRKTLRDYVYPVIGGMPVNEVTSADIMEVLTPIFERGHDRTANDTRQRMRMIFDWAIAYGHRPDNLTLATNRAFVANHRKPVKHHAAMPYADVGDFVRMIRQSGADETNRLCIEYQILNACRPGEARRAVWGEIDLDAAIPIWTIPAEKMKAGKDHRIPLAPRSIEILRYAMRFSSGRPDDVVFPNQKTGKALTYNATAGVLKRRGIPATPHGFRSAFKTWAMECTATPWAVCERALSHTLGGREIEAYSRSDLLDQRRELMEEWADYLSGGN